MLFLRFICVPEREDSFKSLCTKRIDTLLYSIVCFSALCSLHVNGRGAQYPDEAQTLHHGASSSYTWVGSAVAPGVHLSVHCVSFE